MVQYLLNMTVVWGVSLLVYELVLKGETFHAWNRAYLLTALGAGLLVPLISFEQQDASIPAPLQYVLAGKQTILTDSIPETPEAYAINWLLVAYLAGAIIVLLLLCRDVIRLIRAYRSGARTKYGRFTLVETGNSTAPFSFFHFVFIPDRNRYTAEELDMVLAHEYRHASLKHSADMILLLLLRIVLWFHPAVYSFKKYLQLIHEFQADQAPGQDHSVYGIFLLEQNMLQRPSPITHSIQHSPIKKRIMMLTKNASAKSRRSRYLLVVPMAVAFVLCCSRQGFSHEKIKKGNKEIFKGNVFEYTGSGPEKLDKLKNDKGAEVVVTLMADPVVMNGEKIFSEKEVSFQPRLKGPEPNIAKVIFDRIHDKLDQLKDGTYHMAIFSAIIDKKGNFAYYTVRGIEGPGWDFGTEKPKDYPDVDPSIQKEMVAGIEKALDEMQFKPAQANGKAVHAMLKTNPIFNQKIVVKNHKAVLQS